LLAINREARQLASMREITIISLHYKVQWRDIDARNLEAHLAKILEGDPTME